MLPKRLFTITGTFFLLIGALFLINSFQGLTGFVVFEDGDVNLSSYAGIFFIVAGLIVLSWREDGFHSRESLRQHNEEAEYWVAQAYRTEHGRMPSKAELKNLKRKYHERDELHDLIDDERRKYKRTG